MSSKNGSSPDPDPAELVRQIERTRDELAETVDAIADRVSPKRVAARTREKVVSLVKGGAASVSAGADVVKDRVGPGEPPAGPARPLDGGSPAVLPAAAPVAVPRLDLSAPPAGGPDQAGEPDVVVAGTPVPPAVRPEVVAAAAAALLGALLLWRRRRRAARSPIEAAKHSYRSSRSSRR